MDFAAAFDRAAHIGGWMTREQGFMLWSEARRIRPSGRIVEIGSHQGRSTVILAQAAPESTVVAIDPFVEGVLFGGLATKDKFEANIRAADVDSRIDLRQAKSTDLRPTWNDPIDLLYIDGKHDYWTVTDDLKWTDFVVGRGRVLIHDCYSSIGVTLAILAHVLFGSKLRYLDRTGSLARFEVGAPSVADRLRIVAEMPWWIRNVLIKVLLRIGRVFGVRRPDPF